MIPERAIAFMRAFKNEYHHKDVDEACDLAIDLLQRYRRSLRYRIRKWREERKEENDVRGKRLN